MSFDNYNSGVFCESQWKEFYKKGKIVRHYTILEKPYSVSVAKCIDSTLLGKAFYLLSMVSLLKGNLVEAFDYACYLVRRSPLIAFWLKSPFEFWLGSTNFDLELFDCPIYAHANDEKFEKRIKTCLEFEFGVKSFWLWCIEPLSLNLLIGKDVELCEFSILCDLRELVVTYKDPGVCKQVDLLEVETSDKTFDSNILLVVSRERRLSHWYGFAEIVSLIFVATYLEVELVVVWKFKHYLDLFGVADCD